MNYLTLVQPIMAERTNATALDIEPLHVATYIEA
jgi:hypothetical protein